YTAYTPYQAEISQGRLEALLNFQTVVTELTGMEIANASLLDEGTAAAEAMALALHAHRASPGASASPGLTPREPRLVRAAEDCHPQTSAVVQTRARPLGAEVRRVPAEAVASGCPDGTFGVLLQYPGTSGVVRDLAPAVASAKAAGALCVVATD